MNLRDLLRATLLAFLLSGGALTNLHLASAYTPQRGDQFGYSETITVNHGQGSYAGYTDQSQVTGTEMMNGVNGGIVSASYDYSYQYSNNQGSSTSDSSSGPYTWFLGNFTYVNGTDNQNGYSRPIYVWFAVNSSIPVGGTFYALNTHLTVLSRNYSFQLPTEGKYVETIHAQGTGQYQRNDSYGLFAASYTWNEYFDPTTGFIVGYNYVEQDDGKFQGQVGSFTYTDNLYVTSTSYALATASTPSNSISIIGTPSPANPVPFELLVGAVLFMIVILGIYLATHRRKETALPKHPPTPPPSTPPTTPWQSGIEMGSKPSEQVVIREVAKVNCKYCGTLIPSTADVCPYCGGPRQ